MNALTTELQALWKASTATVGRAVSVETSQDSENARQGHRLNAAPVLPDAILIDLETRSACDIEEGGRRYARHPTTEIMTAVALLDDRLIAWSPLLTERLAPNELWPVGHAGLGFDQLTIEFFAGSELPQPLQHAVADGRPLCAHNAFDFDRHVWRARRLARASAVAGYAAPREGGWPTGEVGRTR